jgi:hypothetical protein
MVKKRTIVAVVAVVAVVQDLSGVQCLTLGTLAPFCPRDDDTYSKRSSQHIL